MAGSIWVPSCHSLKLVIDTMKKKITLICYLNRVSEHVFFDQLRSYRIPPAPAQTVSSPASKAVLWIQIQWIWIRIHDFGPTWIRIQGYTIILEKTNFLWNKYIFLTVRSNCHLKKFLISWVSELLINTYLKSYIFCLHFNLYLHVHLQEAPKYDPIRIRIHNTAQKLH